MLANVLVSQAAQHAAPREDEPLPRVGPSFRDATRVAGANSAIWTDIYMANARGDRRRGRRGGGARSARSRRRCARRRGDSRAPGTTRARDDRRRLLEADLAGGEVRELRVTVPNRPGIVAQVALALGRGGVNIVDMALAPAPDNRSGAITLWVAGDELRRARAAELIEQLGFPVARRGS